VLQLDSQASTSSVVACSPAALWRGTTGLSHRNCSPKFDSVGKPQDCAMSAMRSRPWAIQARRAIGISLGVELENRQYWREARLNCVRIPQKLPAICTGQ
jgi:hypothetical protein